MSHPPDWLVAVAWASLAVAFACALLIAADVFVRGYRLPMGVMEAVWPITALYAGPFAVWAYWRLGRTTSPRWLREHDRDGPPDKPRWASIGLGVTHCGAGCTLGDVLAAFLVFWLGLNVAGLALPYEWAFSYAFALALGIAFQYFAIAPMRGLGVRDGLRVAAKADFWSLTAWEVGMFGWMAVVVFVLFPDPHLAPDQVTYWLMMQVAMLVGFATAWPANVVLIGRGIKEAM
ncbi:uncharacterized protein DUF4396 [Mumia flava]|uniref:Uncharacterized protein DUF4396 n=1 Tax=Mumia flava TaxID=1348852 RepID=A0A0B2BRT5_9ACTN|nr:DUF4396 domain-containing protein [Mumia flava]PJJ57598.1 uncharacterized protein DUF4396 [Mumia flava]